MTIRITYFVHGTTTDNEANISSGWYNTKLSELGIKQSLELWDKISDKKIDIVFCSDLERAIHSAELTFGGKIPIIQDARLRECNYGQYNATSSEIVEPMQEASISERFPDGESYEDVRVRMIDFLQFLKEKYE
jgi:alpha-ribazole phosphatase/probable phosphoglycerate mutase